jgi:hypothetical protein
MMLIRSPEFPKGWTHQVLSLHRTWHVRRVWQWKARAVAALTLVALIAVILGADKRWLLASLLGILLPAPHPKTQTLLEIERAQGEIYTTALVAPEDSFGFSKRLLEGAKYVVHKAQLPALPWLEGLGILLLASLAFVIPAQSATPNDSALAVASTPIEQSFNNSSSDPQTAPPVLNAPASGAAPQAGQDAANGKPASGGTPGETGVGESRPGGGNASDDPAIVSRDYLEALERGAVKSSGGQQKTGNNAKSVEDLNSSQTDQNGKGQSGANGQGSQNGQNGKPGQKPGSGQQNNGQQGQNGQQQNGGNNSSNPNGSGKQGQQNQNSSGKNGQKNGKQNGANSQNGADRFDRGENGDTGSFPNQSPDSNQGRSQPGQAGRGGGLGNRLNGANAAKNGKLEYLPGENQGNQVRSGAMQLPGDPKRPLTLTPGTPAYQRAVENAVLDPRLPPEYQEMLKNYYK